MGVDSAGMLPGLTPASFVPSGDRCPLCKGGALVARRVFGGEVVAPMTIRECRHCRFAWQWPVVCTASESVDYFTGEYAAERPGTYFDGPSKRGIAVLEMDFVDTLGIVPGRLLDVGSGNGTFCAVAFERGWTAVGVDPAGPDRETAREGRSCRLVRGHLDAVEPTARFEAVTLWDVVEHLDTPLAAIEACAARLAPGGWLVVETGNYASIGRVVRQGRWWGYQHDHRWYFTPRTLERILRSAGFVEFRLCPRSLRPSAAAMGPYAGPSRLGYLRKALRTPRAAGRFYREARDLAHLARHDPATARLAVFALAARRAA